MFVFCNQNKFLLTSPVGGVVVIIYTKDKIVSYKRDVHGRIYMPETILSIFILIFRKRSCIQIEISMLLVSSYGDDNEDSNNMNIFFLNLICIGSLLKKSEQFGVNVMSIAKG